MGSIITLSGCTYAAIQKLSLDEQAEFHIYQKVMTPSQERAYLAKATTAERTAYLSEIGLAQRLQALDPLDREAVMGWSPESRDECRSAYCSSGGSLTIQPETRVATPTGITWARLSTLLPTAISTPILVIAWTSISLPGRS